MNPPVRKNLAVGYFYNEPFATVCAPFLPRIAEVFFAWPGVLSCRPAPEFTPEVRAQLLRDLHWARDNGISLDTLFNCNCYGELAISQKLADFVCAILDEMDREGLLPETVTTTSPFIATILRKQAPQIRIRASVNMRIHGTIGFEAVADLFDEFYLSREHQRDFTYVRETAAWAKTRGKRLGMQVNSGCLRECPFQQFHDNLHGHNRIRQSKVGEAFDFSVFRCRTHYARDRRLIDILRATWIRPEDVPLWENEGIALFKLATRRIENPGRILKAYAQYDYDGDLLRLLDPHWPEAFAPNILDNKAFPADWATGGIGAACARNCTNCGRCSEVFQTVFHPAK